MSQIDMLLFEMARRTILFKSTTTMPDNTLLGYEGDPNDITSPSTPGEYLLYNAPVGTFYTQSGGTLWYKKQKWSGNEPNIWVVVGASENNNGGDYYSISGGTIYGSILPSNSSLTLGYIAQEWYNIHVKNITINNTTISNISTNSGLTEGNDTISTTKAVKDYVDNLVNTRCPYSFDAGESQVLFISGNTISGSTNLTYYEDTIKVGKNGIILESPNGSKFRIQIDDDGNIKSTPIV